MPHDTKDAQIAAALASADPPITPKSTYGERAVGLSFNPSANPAIDECKRYFAYAIDQMDTLRREAGQSEQGRMASVAITHMQTAQMWAVKALTWRD